MIRSGLLKFLSQSPIAAAVAAELVSNMYGVVVAAAAVVALNMAAVVAYVDLQQECKWC